MPGGNPDEVFAFYDGGWGVPEILDGRPSIWGDLVRANDTGSGSWKMAEIPNVEGSKAGRTRLVTHSTSLTLFEILYYSDAAKRSMNYELLGPMGLGNNNDFILNAMGCNYDGFNVVFTATAGDTGTDVNWSVTAGLVQSKACADAALNVFYDMFTVAFNEKFPYTAPVAEEWDYVIAGAGTSGCALAAQLAKAGERVLLLERGPDNDWTGINRATGAKVDMYDSADVGLSQHHSEVGEGFFHKALPFNKPRPAATMDFGPQGQYYTIYQIDAMYSDLAGELPADWQWMDYEPVSKVVGGCSMHNYQIYIRPGNHSIRKMGWDPEVILTKFAKMEAESLPVTPQAVGANARAFGKAFDDHGCEKFGRGRDVAQSRAECAYGTRDATWHPDMKRIGAGDAFLTKEVRALDNFKLVTHATIQRVIFGGDGVTATGVEYKDAAGTAHSVYGKETVLSAGVLNTPKILMHSGIGPAEELGKFDIPVRADLPVGKEMHNHLFSNPCFLLDNTAVDAEGILSLYMQYRSSFAKESGSDGDIWISPGISVQRPDNTTEFCVTAAIYDNIKSKGQLHLVSPDPDAQLEIDYPYWTESQDVMLMQEGWNFIRQIMEESDFTVLEEITHSPTSRDRDANGNVIPAQDDLDQIIRYSQTVYHNVGTAAIGRVVDDNLRVMGVNNLRVVDNSVAPEVPNSNTQALAYIIGYHGADILLASKELPTPPAPPVPPFSDPSDQCAIFGDFEQSEDVSVWKENLLFVTSGMVPQAKQQGGKILAVDLAANAGKMPELVEIKVSGVPDDYVWSAHGMYIENATQRL